MKRFLIYGPCKLNPNKNPVSHYPEYDLVLSIKDRVYAICKDEQILSRGKNIMHQGTIEALTTIQIQQKIKQTRTGENFSVQK